VNGEDNFIVVVLQLSIQNGQPLTPNAQPTTLMATEENLGDFYKENKKLISDYIDTRIELIKLGAIKTSAKTLSALILIALISFMALFFILFLVIAFSWFMADKLGSASLGFLCGGGLFLLIILISIIFRKSLFLNPLIRIFLHASTQEDEADDENEEF
jgi:hypothetical protein